MKNNNTLKGYLINRFIWIMLGVGISETIINAIYNQFVFPILKNLLSIEIGLVGKKDILTGSFGIIIKMVIMCISSLLPEGVSGVVNAFLDKQLNVVFETELSVMGYSIPQQYENIYYFFVFLILIFLLWILLVPYIIAAVTFTRMLTRKVMEPMEKVTDAMEKTAAGKLDVRLEFETEHEFIKIRDTFNVMAESLYKASVQKEEFEKSKNLMLADIVHDLKTPITTITGYSQALLDGMVKEEKKQAYLDAIHAKSLRMDELISLLFEYSKLESGGMELKKEKGNLAETLRENIAMLYQDFEKKNIDVEVDFQEEYITEFDEVQTARLFSNLLINEIRHNERGAIVYVTIHNDQIIIGDNGEEIAEEIQKNLFEPFVMGDESRSSKGGSGLGLSIAFKIAKMHGWELYLDTQKCDSYTKAFVIKLPGN